jgi:hypothetical protein
LVNSFAPKTLKNDLLPSGKIYFVQDTFNGNKNVFLDSGAFFFRKKEISGSWRAFPEENVYLLKKMYRE